MRSDQAFLLILPLSLFFLMTACANPPAGAGGAPGSLITPPDPAVQATLGARQAQNAAATYDAALAATQVVIQATENARSQATGTAVSAATGTAAAATSTAAGLSARGTQIALVAIETGHAVSIAATGTHQAAAVHAEMTAQAIHMGNAQMLQEAERQRLAAQQQRQETLNTIVGAAREAAELARLASDAETARNLAYQSTLLWLRLLTLTNEGRKYGLYLAVTMTDPTREAIGDHGMRLRRQMATIGFRMNSPASSRAFLDVSGADGLASGSAGLPNGRFVYNISGMVGTAVGFFPDPADLHRFFHARPVALHPLPEALAATIAALPTQAETAAPTHPAEAVNPPYPALHSPPGLISQAARDGQALRPYLAGLKSLNAAGSLLSDVSGRPSGQFLQERLKPALIWLQETENNLDAVRLLARFSE